MIFHVVWDVLQDAKVDACLLVQVAVVVVVLVIVVENVMALVVEPADSVALVVVLVVQCFLSIDERALVSIKFR